MYGWVDMFMYMWVCVEVWVCMCRGGCGGCGGVDLYACVGV